MANGRFVEGEQVPNASKDTDINYGLLPEYILEVFLFIIFHLKLLLFVDCTLELRDNELLMNKLNLLKKYGKADKGQSIHEFKEDPNL